ncbi:WD40 repeat-like protein [Trametes polyzona]|nr:WD40 repeat-like protein [Trametes polyzona]
MAAQTKVLPICTVQHDFQDVVKDVADGLVPEDTFWVSCYKFGEPSIHGKAVATLDEQDRNLIRYEGREGIRFKDEGGYSVACPALGIQNARVIVPSGTYPNPPDTRKQSQITAFDVSPDGSQFATGFHDGSLYIRPTASPSALPTAYSKPHLSTVTSLQFFPSSRVVLTAGADFSLSILPADPPASTPYTTAKVSPARTLRGHTRAITSTAIIARGRNVLSGSKDGTVRLWDVPSGSQIRTLAAGSNHFVPVLALSSCENWQAPEKSGDAQDGSDGLDPREVETSDKVVFCALQDGTFELFDLRTKRAAFRSSAALNGARSALQALAYSSAHNLLATGSASGLTSIYDVRSLEAGPALTFRRNEAPIENLSFVDLSSAGFNLSSSPSGGSTKVESSGVGLAVATEDGLPYVAALRLPEVEVYGELVGTDCDAVRYVRAVGRNVWTAADDGVVRRFSPS